MFDGQFELGAAYEKRGIAVVPEWNVEKCIQYPTSALMSAHTQSFVHSSLTDEEVAAAPAQSVQGCRWS